MQEQLTINVKRVYRVQTNSSLKAFVDIAINDAILIRGIKVFEKGGELSVVMPQEQGKDKKWYTNVKCLNDEMTKLITEEVLAAYQAESDMSVSTQ